MYCAVLLERSDVLHCWNGGKYGNRFNYAMIYAIHLPTDPG